MAPSFEWDDEKARTNQQKHGVTFSEAATVFADMLAAIFPDPEHSVEEVREIIIGQSERNRLLVVSFTERGDSVRIISARVATPRERKNHEDNPMGGPMSDELRSEYEFDYRQAKPNRFAAGLQKGGRLVVLDPEVAAAFRGSQDVNAVLRALLQTMPDRENGRPRVA